MVYVGVNNMKKVWLIIGLIIIVICGVFVGLVFTAGITPIGQITDNTEGFRDQEVTILGKMTERTVFQDDVMLMITDDTGSIMVHTQGAIPAIDDEVIVKGEVSSVIKFGSYEFGTYIEASSIRSPYLWEKLAS